MTIIGKRQKNGASVQRAVVRGWRFLFVLLRCTSRKRNRGGGGGGVQHLYIVTREKPVRLRGCHDGGW